MPNFVQTNILAATFVQLQHELIFNAIRIALDETLDCVCILCRVGLRFLDLGDLAWVSDDESLREYQVHCVEFEMSNIEFEQLGVQNVAVAGVGVLGG